MNLRASAMSAVVAAAGGVLGLAPAVLARIPASWNNPAGGVWSNPGEWADGVVPNNGTPPGVTYEVTIGILGVPPGTPYTIGLDINVIINSLDLVSDDATLDLTSNSLEVLGAFTFTDADILGSAGSVLTIGGASAISNSTFTDVGTLDFGTSTTLDALSRISGGALARTAAGSSITFNGSVVENVTTFEGGAGGTITFNGVTLMGIGTFRSRGDLIFSGLCEEVCDTDIDHEGEASWTAGDINFNGTSTFTNRPTATFDIQTDGTFARTMAGTARFVNEGMIVKSAGAGAAAFNDVEIDNTGTLEVNSGTLRVGGAIGAGRLVNDAIVRIGAGAILEVETLTTFTNNDRLEVGATGTATIDPGANFTNFAAGTLTGGSYIVGGLLRFGGSGLDSVQDATICLDGAASDIRRADDTTGIEDTLTTLGGTTKLELLGGRDYSSAVDFAVGDSAVLKTGAGSDFEVQAGAELTNFNAGTLAQGTFDLKGNLRFDTGGFEFDVIDAKVILDGPGSGISDFTRADLLTQLDTVGNEGDFTIRNGRDFTTGGDFTFAPTGTLNIENGVIFEVPAGAILTNFSGGIFSDGTFNINGRLRAPNAMVNTLRNTVVIRGVGSGIESAPGTDALASLSLIDTTGCLTVLDGASLDVAGPITVLGKLLIGAPVTRDDEGVLRVHDDLIIGSAGGGASLHFQGGRIDMAGSFALNAASVVSGSGAVNVGVALEQFRVGPMPITRGTAEGITINGIISPGEDLVDSTGEITLGGDVAVGDDAVFVFDLKNSDPIDGADRVRVLGDLSFGAGPGDLAGTIVIRLKPTFVAVPGQMFDLLHFERAFGGFAAYEGMELPGGFSLVPMLNEGRFSVMVVPAPGSAIGLGLAVLAFGRRRR